MGRRGLPGPRDYGAHVKSVYRPSPPDVTPRIWADLNVMAGYKAVGVEVESGTKDIDDDLIFHGPVLRIGVEFRSLNSLGSRAHGEAVEALAFVSGHIDEGRPVDFVTCSR